MSAVSSASSASLLSTATATAVASGAALGSLITYWVLRKKDAAAATSAEPLGSHRSTNPYETPSMLHEYLMMHFAPSSLLLAHTDVPDVPWASMQFPAQCAKECIALLQKQATAFATSDLRVLDLGCAVGGSTFELARHAPYVLGIDFSHSFIDAANTLKATGSMEYLYKIEGDITGRATATIDPSIDRTRTHFEQGDACALSAAKLGQFHLLMGANLLCRLPYPRRFLASLPDLIVRGGFVVLFSPHTWLEQYTTKDEWIGGYYDAATNTPVRTFDELKRIMERDGAFRLVSTKNLPFFIRETYRKNQWSVSHMTVFERC